MPPHTSGQWLARYKEEGHIKFVFHLHQMDPNEASLYMMEQSEQLTLLAQNQTLPLELEKSRLSAQ